MARSQNLVAKERLVLQAECWNSLISYCPDTQQKFFKISILTTIFLAGVSEVNYMEAYLDVGMLKKGK